MPSLWLLEVTYLLTTETNTMADPTLLNGLAGGLIATIVMTVFMMTLGDDSPPPTAVLWAKYVGDGPPENYMPQGMALHMLYGIGAGVVFALVVPLMGFSLTLVTAVVLGLAYGLALTIVGMVFWMNLVLGMDPDPGMMATFLVFHLVYGSVLGAWLTLGIL